MKQYSVLKIVGLLLPVIFLIVQPAANVNAQTISPLSINQLLYATVPNFVAEGNPMVTLNNGILTATDYNAPQYSINLDTDSSSYTTGDFLNTGVSDIAAIIAYNGGGSGFFYYLVVFVNNNGAPQYLTATEMGDRITINKIGYNNGIFSADIITQGPNDPMCCGTLHEVLQYQLQNGSLVAVNNLSNTPVALTGGNTTPAPINSQAPPSPVSSSSSADNTQWLILGGLVFVVLFIISFALSRRKRARKIAAGRNPNPANAIYLTIIGIACLFAENEFFIFIGFVIMFFAWRLYAKGKPKLRARTTRQDEQAQSTNSSNNDTSSSRKNEEPEPVKKRRPREDPEMKALYRKLMHKYHPDRGRNKDEDGIRNDITAKINKAYREGDFETLKLFE